MPKRKYYYTKKYRDLAKQLHISSSSSLSSSENEINETNNENQENQLLSDVFESDDEFASGFQSGSQSKSHSIQYENEPAQILSTLAQQYRY